MLTMHPDTRPAVTAREWHEPPPPRDRNEGRPARAIREALGLPRDLVAALHGMTDRTFATYESANNFPEHHARRLCECYRYWGELLRVKVAMRCDMLDFIPRRKKKAGGRANAPRPAKGRTRGSGQAR